MVVYIILTVLCLMSAVIYVNGAAPYYVNSQRSTNGCTTDSYLDFETGTLDVIRGSRGAPCVGYLKFAALQGNVLTSNRICSTWFVLINTIAAKRACWTLGTNLHRDNITGEETMLYSCEVYRGANVEFPDIASGSNPVSAANPNVGVMYEGKKCNAPFQANTDCFGECYGIWNETSFIDNANEIDCTGVHGLPYWATTCSDIDECLNGVHGKCEGPFEQHCTLRPACGHNTKCTNMPGMWECECLDGFNYASSSDLYDPGIGCIDIDECEEPDICGVNGQCINTNGSYFCICTSLQMWDKSTGKCTVGQCRSPPALPNAYTSSTSSMYDYEDEITYNCVIGHHIAAGEVSRVLPTYYWYSPLKTFNLTCDAHGEWGPQPFPTCIPVYCGNPGFVPNAMRSGGDFHLGAEVRFNCNKGFAVTDGQTYKNSFKATCQANGTWTDIKTCEDINECDNGRYPCGVYSKRCINTVGTYFCICAPGYYQDENIDDLCILPEFPRPCTMMENLQLCDHGTCRMYDDKAICSCEQGYEGKLCDRPTTSIALIIATVALALTGFFILMLIVFCLLPTCRPGLVGPVRPAGPPLAYQGVGPVYAKRPVPWRSLGAHHVPF